MKNIKLIKDKVFSAVKKIFKRSKSKKGVEISLKVIIKEKIKQSKTISFIKSRAPDAFIWLFIYAILTYILKTSGWHLFVVSISVYFIYKEIVADIQKTKILGGK